jgi:hypothetical protein
MMSSVSVKNHASLLRATHAEAPPVPEEFPTPATTKMGRAGGMMAVTVNCGARMDYMQRGDASCSVLSQQWPWVKGKGASLEAGSLQLGC